MRVILAVILGVTVAAPAVPQATRPSPSVSLFDGRTFKNWEGDPKTFRVEDGAIVGGTLKAKIPRNEFLCTEREYTDFVLRLRFKVLGEGANAGVQIRSKRIPNDHEVIGYQADLGDGWWGSLYDESRRNKTLARPEDAAALNRVLKRNDWNDYLIRAEGRRIRLSINGLQTVDYTEPDEGLSQTGNICLQIHSGPPSEAWYKDIRIEELPGKQYQPAREAVRPSRHSLIACDNRVSITAAAMLPHNHL